MNPTTPSPAVEAPFPAGRWGITYNQAGIGQPPAPKLLLFDVEAGTPVAACDFVTG